MAFEYAIALTGGISTGKSTVADILNLYIIDADKIAHEILNQQRDNIAKLFGSQFIKDNRVDRKRLGAMIFDNSNAKKRLEELLHPLIYSEIERRSSEQDRFQKPYIIDIPLFFETNRYPITKSLLVYTPREKQLERLMIRDNFSQKEAERRVNTQMSIEEKRDKTTYLIDNSQDLKALQLECAKVKKEILSQF